MSGFTRLRERVLPERTYVIESADRGSRHAEFLLFLAGPNQVLGFRRAPTAQIQKLAGISSTANTRACSGGFKSGVQDTL